MKIVFIAHAVHPPWSNASKSLTYNLVRALNTVRHSDRPELHFITHCHRHSYSGYEQEYADFLKNFEQSTVLDYVGSIDKASPTLYKVFKKLLKEKADDTIAHLIDINPLLFGLANKLQSRCPVVHHVYMPYFEETSWAKKIPRAIGAAFTYNLLVNKIIATSPLTKGYMDRLLVDTDRAVLLYPPIDTNHYRHLSRMRRKPGLNTDYTLLYLGVMHPGRFPAKLILNSIREVRTKHGLDVGLLAIVRWSQAESCIGEIHSYARKLGLEKAVRVEVRFLDEKEKLSLYNNSTAFLQLLGGFYAADPPISMLEAMACGVPPIATYSQSIPYLIQHSVNGVLIRTPDSRALSEAISLSINDNRRLGINARRTIERKMSYQVTAPKLLATYTEMLQED